MDNIKLRVWSLVHQIMFSTETDGASFLISKNNVSLIMTNSFSNDVQLYDSSKKQIIPMLGTGLIDCNNKDVYEGDIVEIENCLAEVKWDNYVGRFYLECLPKYEKDWCEDWRIDDIHRMEIVSNIYDKSKMDIY